MATSGITPITHITSVTKTQQQTQNTGSAGSVTKNFGEMLGNAIDSLNQTETNANNAIAKLAAGEDVDLHQVMLAMQEADIAFQVALQTRNKIVNAYQEIMRMQV